MEQERKTSPETQQIKLLKKQLFYSRITCSAIVIFLLIFSIVVIPPAVGVLRNLNELTEKLNQVDIKDLEADLNKNLEQINESLEDLDTNTLNHAIEKLDGVAETLDQAVRPLRELYQRKD